MNVSPGLAFLAGLASFLSPCVFAIIPCFFSYLGSRSLSAAPAEAAGHPLRWELVGHGLMFLIGFGVLFIFPRVMVSELGGALYNLRDWLSKIGGLFIIILGLLYLGVLQLPALSKRLFRRSLLWPSFALSGLVGAFFSAGWAPCVGPTLGGILTLGMGGSATGESATLLSFYMAGLSAPFLLLAGGLDWFVGYLVSSTRAARITRWILSGGLIVMGGMLSMGIIEQTARFGFFVNFGL